jgi:hypothetical protein
MFASEQGWDSVGLGYLEAYIEPFGTLWFIYLLPIFVVVTKAMQRVPWQLTWRTAAALEISHRDTGWTVINGFACRFVYIYSS